MGQLTLPPTGVQEVGSHEKTTRLSSLTRFPIFESLQFPDFRWVWLGSFASFMAMNMQMITRGWLVLRLADDSPLALSLVMVAFAFPLTFVSLLGGALADRIPRKSMIMLSQGGNAIMTLLLATLDITGLIEFWHLLAIGVVNGSMFAFNMPSRQALISEIVPVNRLMNAISLNNSGMNLARAIGPAVAGVLIIYLDTAGVFYLITGFYIFSVLSVSMINTGVTPASSSRKSVTGDIREGLSYAFGNPTLLGLIIMAFIPVLFGFSYFALLPAWAREALDVHSDGLGMLMMTMGIGALIGSLILASMCNFKRRGALLLVNSVSWGVALAIFSQTTSYQMTLPFLMLVGLLSSVFMSLNMTLMQIYATPEMRGRMMSIIMMTFGVMPLSALPFGAIAERIGTPNALGLSGLMLAGFTIIFAVGYPRFRRIA
ncbi:MAG: MFS transporter [Desulfatiglandales bacterium]